MFGFTILESLFINVIATKYVREVYHSVRLAPNDTGQTVPFAPVDGRFQYVGINDVEGFSCYCRQIGPAEVRKEDRVGGCKSKVVTMNVPHRLIFFNQMELRSHEDIIATLVEAVIKSYRVRLIRVQNISETLLQQEVPFGKFTFTPNTFYQGIDFFVLLELQTENCTKEIRCEGVRNPFRVTE